MAAARIIWRDAETDYLVEERRHCNHEYHYVFHRNKLEFWQSVTRKINQRYNGDYSSRQCEQKWRNLVRDYGVSK